TSDPASSPSTGTSYGSRSAASTGPARRPRERRTARWSEPCGRASAPPTRSWIRRRSALLEVGLALLGERARTLLGVLGREDGPADLELAREAVDLRHAFGLAHRLLDRLDRQRAVVADRRRQLERHLEGRAVGHHPPDEPDRQRLLRRVGARRQEPLHGLRVGDLPAQAYGRAAHREEPAARLAHAERRALAGDPDVGALEALGAARHRVALYRGDERLPQ